MLSSVSTQLNSGFYFNFNFNEIPTERAKQNGFEKKLKKKRSQPCQALISLFLSACVFVPIISGGLLSSTFSPGESFAIVISDPGAAENRMNISIFKIFPVNSGAVSEKKTSVNRGVVRSPCQVQKSLKSYLAAFQSIYCILGIPHQTPSRVRATCLCQK